ncbi:MAG: hypothetical protein IIB09_09965, partial [Bacteroidetes bacterium]|nr:hypothetical protein [Bacteroidota bacterium]
MRSVLEAVSGTRSLYRRAPTEAVELYRPDGALFAWSGFAVPQDRLTLSEGISDTLRTAVAMDGPRRRTITLWLPVRRGDEVIGAVRVMRRAQVSVPVRNQYLQDYNLADEWKDGALPPFSVLFTESQTRGADASQLLGLDGTLLGWVSVDPPNEGFLTGHVLGLTHGVITFWVVLLVGWLMVGFLYVVDGKTHEASSSESSWRTAGALLVGWCLAWWGLRYGLLAIDVPARWLEAWSPGAALFDPHHLASHVGAGALGSAGDLIVTAVFAVVLAVAVLRFALARAAAVMRRQARGMSPAGVVGALVLAGLGIAAIAAFSVGARHAVLDATLGYFERSGPIPDRITFVVLMALLAGAFAAIAFAVACVLLARIGVGWNRPAGSQAWKIALGIAGGLLAVIAITNTSGGTPSWVAITLFAFSSAAGALFLVGHRDRWAWPLTFRGMLFSVLVLVTLTYVVMARADRERENVLIEEAAEDFARGQDQRAVYAIEQVLTEARSQDLRAELIDVMQRVEEAAPAEPDALVADSSSAGSPRATFPPIQDDTMIRDSERVALDDFVSRLVSGSFLASLADYSVDLAVLNAQGDTLATYVGDVPPDDGEPQPARVGKDDPLAFDSLLTRYQREERPGFLVL